MSIINKMLDLSLQQKVLQSEISDMAYKITNGKKLSNKNFYEGIVNPGTIDIVSAPDSKITKDMILDYRQKEDERTYKNAAGEDVKFQNTGLAGDLLEYKPKFEGDDVDLKGARQDLEDMMIVTRRKEKEADKQKKVLEDLFMQENELHQELVNTSFWTLTGRTQQVVAREKRNIERDIRVAEREYQKIYEDFLVLIEEVNTQADKIDVIQANIKDNAKEKAIIEKNK